MLKQTSYSIIFLKSAKVLCALAFLCSNLIGQTELKEIPFKAGEQLNYDVFYELKGLWVPAGKVRFEVSDTLYKGNNCLFLDGKGKSLKSYDYFFKVRDRYSSIVDAKTLEPQKFKRQVNEGGFKLYYDYQFDNKNEKATVITSRKEPSKIQTINFPKGSMDVITCVYYARTLNFENKSVGDTIPMKMMVDKQIYDNVYIRYTGKETIKGQDGKRYDCIKFRPLLIEGTIFEEGEFMEVYVTDDENHVPVYVEAQILVGSIRAYLSSAKNIK